MRQTRSIVIIQAGIYVCFSVCQLTYCKIHVSITMLHPAKIINAIVWYFIFQCMLYIQLHRLKQDWTCILVELHNPLKVDAMNTKDSLNAPVTPIFLHYPKGHEICFLFVWIVLLP